MGAVVGPFLATVREQYCFQTGFGPLPTFSSAWAATAEQPTVAAYLKRAADFQLGVVGTSEARVADAEKRAKAAADEAKAANAAAAAVEFRMGHKSTAVVTPPAAQSTAAADDATAARLAKLDKIEDKKCAAAQRRRERKAAAHVDLDPESDGGADSDDEL